MGNHRERRDKKIASECMWRNLPRNMIFDPQISEKKIFWCQSNLNIHRIGMNSRRIRPYLCKSKDFAVRLYRGAWAQPILKLNSKYINMCSIRWLLVCCEIKVNSFYRKIVFEYIVQGESTMKWAQNQ